MNKEKFLECWENADTDTKVSIWNLYAYDEDADVVIYNNDDDFFDLFFHEEPMEAVRAAFFGSYKYNDNFVWWNGYGNLSSSDFADDMPIDVDDLFDYLEKHTNDLWVYDDFAKFVEDDKTEE